MLLKKKVILTTTTRCVASRFSSKASTIHSTFHIQCKGCCNPTLRECEDETHTPKMGTWESSGTLES